MKKISYVVTFPTRVIGFLIGFSLRAYLRGMNSGSETAQNLQY